MSNQPSSDYDSAWKEAITIYFEPFMAFCFSDAYQDINWSRGYETLDTELQQVIRDAETGRRLADKLVKVSLHDGEDALVLIHVEIQGQVQSDFAERMYIYNHRLFDRYRQKVFSFAVLGDENTDWRPNSYSYRKWGFHSHLQFPVVKLLDYKADILEQSTNPFAVIIMAHLQTQATRGNSEIRLQSKLSLVRRLYERGYSGEQIRQLFRFIEWMMALPPGLQQEFKTELQRDQETKRMSYIVSFELDGILKGSLQTAREDVSEILETRFDTVPKEISDRLNQIEDLQLLKRLHKRSITIISLLEFEQFMAENQPEN